MKQVVIVGCGVVGAMIAYELSRSSQLHQITVLDRQPPAQAATGAALGVLMGIISQKTKGRAWVMRQASIQRYKTLLPELAAIDPSLHWNRQGIVKLCFATDNLDRWQALIQLRQQQGWHLELWTPEQMQAHCPQVESSQVTAAIYSPEDYQVNPTALTLALVKAARQQGVTFRFDVAVESLVTHSTGNCQGLITSQGKLPADWVIVAAGLGSTPLTAAVGQAILTQPVLGQAIQARLTQSFGTAAFQPVITGDDIHIVPLSNQDYWIGATVEFPADKLGELAAVPDNQSLAAVWQAAVALCPVLEQATILKTWSGLRPRPVNRSAPIVELLAGYRNIYLATGHYRNGVLLAPATAQLVQAALEAANREC